MFLRGEGEIVMEIKPVVFSVGDTYQIAVVSEKETVMWVNVGGVDYFDESNGVLRSDVLVHMMTVPKKALDSTAKYTINYRFIFERKAYFTDSGEIISKTFEFAEPKKDNIRIYHLADCHENYIKPIASAKTYGDFDMLILNGDIHENSGGEKCFMNIYRLAQELTSGRIPVVYARGNHDTRGKYAEKLALYTPTQNGNSYYTFRIGNVWGLVLDCGEDKLDSHAEYGNTICCAAFRQRETQFIKEVIANKDNEYNAPGVKHRFVVSHTPFTERNLKNNGEFDIENDTYNEWVALLNDEIKPEFLLSGHTHCCRITRPGTENDHRGQKFTTVIGVESTNTYSVIEDEKYFIGTGIDFKDKETVISLADSLGKVEAYTI